MLTFVLLLGNFFAVALIFVALAQDMQDESFKKLQTVKKKIEDFLMEYNKDKKYSFIIMNQNDLVYYRDSSFNITNNVVEGLNKLYKKK